MSELLERLNGTERAVVLSVGVVMLCLCVIAFFICAAIVLNTIASTPNGCFGQ